jgi:tetratricopeptide (TPR) repeat protein
MVRTALTLGDRELAAELTARVEPSYALDEHALCAARAQLAEDAGELEEAVGLYAEATSRWQEFGNVPEHAYALLGQGRCLRALGRFGAEEPLLEARELFASMGYKPALADVEELLGQPAPIS